MVKKEDLFKVLRHYELSINEDYISHYHSETINHIIRCSKIAKDFGIYLNLCEKDLNKLIICALLHDIGKFKLDQNILYKNGRLTDEEYEYIKGHTKLEGDFSKLDPCILDCISYHHDNPCKTGYNKIDVSTKHELVKIITLIDCYDVMCHKRCYKDYTLPLCDIILDIQKNIGKQFDSFYGNKFIDFILKTNVINFVS